MRYSLTNFPETIICDLDGTLALLNGRNPYDTRYCELDGLNLPVARVLHSFAKESVQLVICSGRMEHAREKTDGWLKQHGIDCSVLLLRLQDDNRKDAVVKKEMYDKFIKNQYHILFVLDDRQQVVDMWRSEGLTCFQVAPGNF